MENKTLKGILNDNVSIKITGEEVNSFIYYLIRLKIKLYDITYLSPDKVVIVTTFNNYKRIINIKNKYKIKIIKIHGKLKIKEVFYLNKILFISIIIGYITLVFLSNIIFDIEIVHNKTDVRKNIEEYLKEYNIKKLSFKKSYKRLEQIENDILNKHHDDLEWIEITESGTKYIVRLEERKNNTLKKTYNVQNIVANNNAIIKKIIAKNGEIVKNIDDYVKKGDIIITGLIKNGENIMSKVPALGEVYGEVWYKVRVEVPFHYVESHETGKHKKVLCIYFLNKKWEIFNSKKYKDKNIIKKILSFNLLSPLKFVIEDQNEIVGIDSFYTEGEAISKAIEIGKEKIEGNFSTNEKILSEKVLNFDVNGSKMIVDIYYMVYKNIGMAEEIKDEIENIE